MSAVGKLDNSGDFDENGQLVETPYRASLTKQKAVPVKAKAKAKPAQPIPEATQDLVRPRRKSLSTQIFSDGSMRRR